jgi:glycosyltransferase involved in cell wall biosynthesis
VPRCAIVHYWLLGMRGGEKVVEALCRLFPDADLFTLFYDPESVSRVIRSHRVKTSFLNPLKRYHRSLLPVMPVALESFDLREYDVIISSESGPAKGVITPANALHICYCHSPMRYLWDLYPAYLHEWTRSPLKRETFRILATPLRLWDYSSAARVDHFVANSRNVQRRIWRTYRRESQVIYPPVPVETFYNRAPEGFYLAVSELVSYKRIEDAVRCFSHSGRQIKIVGDGPEYRLLKRLAGKNIEFCGRVSDEQLRGLYARCRALVMPGEEDFGLVGVEAVASGKAVIALGRGGVLESAPLENPRAGFFYDTPGEASLEEAIRTFEKAEAFISARELQLWATRFSEAHFGEAISRTVAVHTAGQFHNNFTSPLRQAV